jgi:GMP synthase (glutamine-hydrolysing)
MKILTINSAPYTKEFVKPIVKTLIDAGIESELANYDNIPNDLDRYGGVIISASPRGDDIVNAHIPYYEWLRNSLKPILGICHGHQFIGVMHGADLIRDEQSEEGKYLVDIKEDNALFSGYNGSFQVEQHHKDSITLPNEFRHLASSTRCKVQAMIHQEKPIYTTQFHAEKNPEIILNFAEIVRKHIQINKLSKSAP